MKATNVVCGYFCMIVPLFVYAKDGAAQSYDNSSNKNVFHYAVSNQVIEKTQKQNLFSVLKELNKKKGVFFLFSDSSIANKQVNAPDFKNEIDDIILQVFKNTGLKYKKISANTFVITNERATTSTGDNNILFNLIETPFGEPRFVSINDANLPQRKITGKVTGKNGVPLEGVTIKVKGQKTGTTTKADGSFSILVPDNATLEFSAVGYLSTTAKVNAAASLSIALQESAADLDDVVVVAYGTQKRSTFTGSATTVRQQMLEDVPRASFQESLQGNAVGVLSTNGTGQPGAAPSVRIRGVGSITASSTPLYVVDGVPLVSGDISNGLNSNTIAAINAMDIQSTVILKDAAATALYGSRGANGVILLTTKRGKAGKTIIDCRAQTGVSFYSLNQSKDKTLNSSQMVDYLRNAWANAGNAPADFNAELTKSHVDTTVNTNWFKEILHTGQYANMSLNLSGGNEKTTFYISGGLFQQDGTQRNTDYKKITTMISVTHKATDKLTVSAGFSGAYQLANSSVVGATYENPTRAMYRLQSWLTPKNLQDGSYRIDFNNGYNPVAIQTADIRRTTTYVLRGVSNGIYKLGKGFTYETTAGLDFSYAFNLQYNDPRYGNGNASAGGSVANYFQDIASWVWTNIIRYKKTINIDNNFEVFGGYESSMRTGHNLSATGSNLAVRDLYSIAVSAIPSRQSSTPTKSSLVSQFVNGTYTFKNRYYISGSFRNDGSSKFGYVKQSDQFWSVGAGWDITKESFLNIKWLYDLKLRSSYGKTGNSIGLADFGPSTLYDATVAYNDQPGIIFSQIGNPYLTWEKNYPWNIGLDAAFLKNRIVTSVDWYTRKTTDLILAFPVPNTSGQPSVNGGYGSMRNTGFEIVVNTINILPKKVDGFGWKTQAMFTTNQNTILKLARSYTGTYDRHVGIDYYQFYMPSYAGVDSSNGKAQWLRYDTAKKQDVITNNWGSAKYYDQGSALPKFYGSLINTFSYKRFSLLIQFYYNWGNKVLDDNGTFNSSDGSAGFSATGNVPYYDYIHRWKKPGDITDVPAPVFEGIQTGLSTQNSSRFLYDGSYIRLRDIMLSYDLPARVLAKAKIATAKIYFRANNLYTFVKDKRLLYDPETPVDGTLNLRPPKAITFLLGMNVNF
ncbi:SusC/RagA family TonB-linked outer membrane protein [Parasediminibacterium sp. JCM 36343]|uniref:SusC/RagA family TonB-linked outer membrane protein n=1 Tax=Parasediminibacterium sp. JCM 36343 TaxID=3374279 RepID=UPI00397912C4